MSSLASSLQSLSQWLKLLGVIAYCLASATWIFRLKRRKQDGRALAAALLLSVLDLLLPFAFKVPSDVLLVQILLFHLPVTRPIKLILYAFDRGPLTCAGSLREHLVLANFPVIPVASLPGRAQAKLPVYKATQWRIIELVLQLPLAILTCMAVRAHAPAELSWWWVCTIQLLGFIAQLTLILNGAALATTYLIDLPVIAPFNQYWKASSVQDFWSWRWDTVSALPLPLANEWWDSVLLVAMLRLTRT